MREICPIVRLDGARRFREKDKKQKSKSVASGNREHTEMFKRKKRKTQGF